MKNSARYIYIYVEHYSTSKLVSIFTKGFETLYFKLFVWKSYIKFGFRQEEDVSITFH